MTTLQRPARRVNAPAEVDDPGSTLVRLFGAVRDHLLETGGTLFRRNIARGDPVDFPRIEEARSRGETDYVALVHRFAADGVIGEMDCVYSAWASDAPDGFPDPHVEALTRLAPFVLARSVVQKKAAPRLGQLAAHYRDCPIAKGGRRTRRRAGVVTVARSVAHCTNSLSAERAAGSRRPRSSSINAHSAVAAIHSRAASRG